MATSIYFNGRVISVPGSYSEVDASALETQGLGAVGIVALIGTAEGGTPVSTSMVPADFPQATRPQQVRDLFKSGDLREGGALLMEPSSDADITAGASKIYFMKTNQATQATSTFSNGFGSALLVTSADYAAFADQINLEFADGSERGKLITVRNESVTETADNIGGTPTLGTGETMFSLTYQEETGIGWDTMNAQVLSSGIRAYATRAETGKDSDILSVHLTGVMNVQSSAAGDTTQTATVYGLVGGVPTRETVSLAGTALVPTANIYDTNGVFALELDAVAVGTVTIEDSATTNVLSIAPAALVAGGVKGSTMYVASQGLHAVADGAETGDLWLVGRNTSGAIVIDRFAMTGAVPLSGAVTNFTEILFIVLSEIAAARTITINGNAVVTSNSTQDTVLKARDFYNARQKTVASVDYGFTFTLVTGLTTFLVSNLDQTSASVNVDNPVTGLFYADLYFMAAWITSNSEQANAARIAFVPKVYDVVIDTVADAQTYTFTINSTAVTYTSDASATAAEIQAGLIAYLSAASAINFLVTAAVQGAASIRVTASTPAGFVISEADTRLSLSSVSATAGVGSVPSNTTNPVFLSGGTEGTSTSTEYQVALNLLKQIRVNTIVLMTGDPAVHAMLVAHCDYMGGIGRSERDGCVGLLNAAQTDLPTKTEAKTQAVDLNTRHIRAFAQEVEAYNTSNERVTLDSRYQACVAAGMQAGSDIGTSLTYKYGKVLSVNQSSTWNPIDDAEEMINAGICFMETVDGVGRRFVRNNTTHLQSNNLAYVEASVNEAVNFATFTFRTEMEVSVGKKGFSGTINAARSVAMGTLGLLVDAEILVAYQALALDLTTDVLDCDVQMAPVIPINFIKNTIHLVTIRQAA